MTSRKKARRPDPNSRGDVFLVAGSGVLFVALLLLFSNFERSPTPLSILSFRVALSLAAAGAAAALPGFLHLRMSLGRQLALRAGGSLAVAVFVYKVDPPALVAPQPESYLNRLLRAHTNAEVSDILTELEASMATSSNSDRESLLKQIVTFTSNFKKESRGDDAVRELRSRMLNISKAYANGNFRDYFEEGAFANGDWALADFSNSTIYSKDFTGSFLLAAKFMNCDLYNCRFNDAFLRAADFTGATLDSIEFINSDWYNAFGLTDDELDLLVSEGRLGACPVSIEAFIADHDDQYQMVPFRNLEKVERDRLLAQWKRYLARKDFIERVNTSAKTAETNHDIKPKTQLKLSH